jgi:hypothetical protein
MRKKTFKLALCKETVRELAGKGLSRVVGGLETDTAADVLAQSRDKQCLVAAR